jgi:protein-S-isoprenylcysteine O-methyltransferase Ste14
MGRLKSLVYKVSPMATGSVMGILTVAQVVLTFVFNQPGLHALRLVGYVLWALSAVFGILPIITLRRRGGVPEGKSYMQTAVLVDSGPYAVVRHPQFLAGILLNVSCMLVAQHWLIVALGIPSILLTYLDAHRADDNLVAKFGEAYVGYMERVPRLDFVAGTVRLLRRNKLGGILS